MNKKQKLINLFELKYGKEITSRLLPKNGILNFENRVKKGEGIIEVNNQLRNLIEIGLLDASMYEKYSNKGWAFDFPGWIGQIKENPFRIRDYMIVQAEPHVETFDYQFVYEFAERKYGCEFEINGNSITSNSGTNIWSRVVKFLSSDAEFESIFENGDKKTLYKILESIYITDICHFSPQIGSTDLNNDKDWKKKGGTRDLVSKAFFHKEISIVNPKIIFASGRPAKIAAEKYILPYFDHDKIYNSGDFPNNNFKSFPEIYELREEGELKSYLIMVPHIGADMPPPEPFWNKRSRELNKEIKSHINKNWL